MHRGGSVRIRKFGTGFTRFSLEIRKNILFFLLEYSERNFRIRIKWTEGNISRTIGVATTGTTVDTLCVLVEFS